MVNVEIDQSWKAYKVDRSIAAGLFQFSVDARNERRTFVMIHRNSILPLHMLVRSRRNMRFTQSLFAVLIVLGLSGSLNAQSWSGIISPSRAIDWSTAGVPGGIPNR